MRSLKYSLPILAFVAIAVALYDGLSLNPKEIPSALINKPVPEFDLPPVQGYDKGLASSDLKGDVALVNVFASWCVACRAEHPVLMDLSKSGQVPVYGLNYKDKPANAAAWLDEHGNPYSRTGADEKGRVGIDFGVYGVPETFVIDRHGRIAYKHIGPVRREDLDRKILPLVKQLREAG